MILNFSDFYYGFLGKFWRFSSRFYKILHDYMFHTLERLFSFEHLNLISERRITENYTLHSNNNEVLIENVHLDQLGNAHHSRYSS